MNDINNLIPEGAKHIIDIFTQYGHQAYLVGGCVRDIILGRTPNDWDICTDATPERMELLVHCMIIHEEETKEYYEENGNTYIKRRIKTIPTGLKHGTLTIIIDDEAFEVTTFRQDGSYSDGRRPDNVSFTNNLVEDLKRRDFTSNAIVYHLNEGFIDPFNGMTDIENKVIRCVGNPNDRFNEDGLRILRAIRFAAQLGFTIEKETAKAIHENKHLLNKISRERIQSELFKILESNSCGNKVLREYADVICVCIPEIEPMIGFQQNNPYHLYDVWEHTLHCMDSGFFNNNKYSFKEDIFTRLAILLHDIGKPHCYVEDVNHIGHFYGHAPKSASIAEAVLKNLKCSNEIISNVCELIAFHDVQFVLTKSAVKRLLNKLGETQLRRLIHLRMSDIRGQKNDYERQNKCVDFYEILNEVLAEESCFKLKDLAINGKDLIEHGIPEGKAIGTILNTLLTMVIDGEINNDKSNLLQMADILTKVNKR